MSKTKRSESTKTAPTADGPRIPWALHLRAWRKCYGERTEPTRSPELIAARGGFSLAELDRLVPGWRGQVSL